MEQQTPAQLLAEAHATLQELIARTEKFLDAEQEEEALADVLGQSQPVGPICNERGEVCCEACSVSFKPGEGEGYYEAGEYAYCSECCHW